MKCLINQRAAPASEPSPAWIDPFLSQSAGARRVPRSAAGKATGPRPSCPCRRCRRSWASGISGTKMKARASTSAASKRSAVRSRQEKRSSANCAMRGLHPRMLRWPT